MDKTGEILDAMLKENTGRAMCDSGDYYGRHWQRNQGKDFAKEQPSVLRFDVYGERDPEISATHSIYHWLKEKVTYHEGLDSLFSSFAELPENKDESWFALVDKFLNEYLPEPCDHPEILDDSSYNCCEYRGHPVTGMEDSGKPMVVNTYNGEDNLSQNMWYAYFEIEGLGAFSAIMIHGGCDARGGYTRPRFFEPNEDYALFDNAKVTISCAGAEVVKYECEAGHKWQSMKTDQVEVCPTCLLKAAKRREETTYHRWDSDSGYKFSDESWPEPKMELLDPWVVIHSEEGQTVEGAWKLGTTVVDADTKKGYCPHCAAELSSWWQ